MLQYSRSQRHTGRRLLPRSSRVLQPGWGMMLSQPPIQYILGGHRATWGTLTLRDRAARKPAGPITTRRPVVQVHPPQPESPETQGFQDFFFTPLQFAVDFPEESPRDFSFLFPHKKFLQFVERRSSSKCSSNSVCNKVGNRTEFAKSSLDRRSCGCIVTPKSSAA